MRPSATESLYKELEIQEGAYEYSLPAAFAIRPLRLSDVDQVVALEEKCFSAEEGATREKLEHRLKVCPELCAGLFLREFDWHGRAYKPDGSDASEDNEEDEDDEGLGVVSKHSTLTNERLVGHIISTKTVGDQVTDESMAIGGHREDGDTIAVHSVAVDPEFRGRHMGYIMIKDYVQKFFGLCNAEGMSLLAKESLVPFYAKHGFRDLGNAKSKHGGITWRALRLPFDTYDDQVEE